MNFTDAMEGLTRAFEILAAAIFVFGSLWAFAMIIARAAKGRVLEGYKELRRNLGRIIILGLEILIVADIIRTMTVDISWESVLGLAVIVAVRTFLSFALEIELEGVVPWRRGKQARACNDSEEGTDKGTDSDTGR